MVDSLLEKETVDAEEVRAIINDLPYEKRRPAVAGRGRDAGRARQGQAAARDPAATRQHLAGTGVEDITK